MKYLSVFYERQLYKLYLLFGSPTGENVKSVLSLEDVMMLCASCTTA